MAYATGREVTNMNREMRKTSAQFANGVAVAVIGAGIVVPAAAGTARYDLIAIALVVSALLHFAAIALVSKR